MKERAGIQKDGRYVCPKYKWFWLTVEQHATECPEYDKEELAKEHEVAENV